MPDLLYFIWALLPLALLWSIFRAAGKKVLKTGKRESPLFYLKQLGFAVGALVVAIILDRTIYESFAPMLKELGIEPRIVRWLIYPAILTAGALVQQRFVDKKVEEENADKKARRMKYAEKH